MMASLLAMQTLAAQPVDVYFGTYDKAGFPKGIYHAVLDLKTGSLSSPELAATASNPTFLEIHPNSRFLYSVTERDPGMVSAFAIDRETKRLRLINSSKSCGKGPCHVSVSDDGRVLLVANYGSGSVASIPINKDGSLSEAASAIQHTGSSGLATVSVPSLTAGAGFAIAASGATSVTASGVSVVPLTLYGHNVSQTADLLDVYNYSGGSIVAAISPTGGLAGSSLVITGCGAGYYAKADGAGCGIPAGTYSLPTATSSTLGGVKPDGSTITNTSGAISVNYGTTSGTAAQGNDSRITGAAQCTAGTASGNCITNSMTGLGDLLYGGASGASTKLTGFTGGDGQLVVLTETTSGGGPAQAPAWVLPSTMTVGYAGTSTNVDGATNCILYNSSTNITGCISGVNNAVVVTNSSGTPSEVTTLPAANLPAATPTVAGVVVKVANTTFTTSTSSVAANTCNSTVQVAMTGVTTSMTFGITPSADTSAAAGWGSTGGLVLDTWPTAGYLNYKICNQTTAAISTPGAVTFNVSAQ